MIIIVAFEPNCPSVLINFASATILLQKNSSIKQNKKTYSTVWSSRLGQEVASPHFRAPGPGREGPERLAGRGHRSPGSGKGRFEPGRAVSPPWRDSLLRPATPPRTFIFLRFFTIPASEPSNSIEISLFCCFQGHRLPGYPHQTLENLQDHPYCILCANLGEFSFLQTTLFPFDNECQCSVKNTQRSDTSGNRFRSADFVCARTG